MTVKEFVKILEGIGESNCEIKVRVDFTDGKLDIVGLVKEYDLEFPSKSELVIVCK